VHAFAPYRILLFISLLALIIYGVFSERIPVNSGTGWDGKHYATLAKDIDQLWAEKQIDSYQFYRLLPPACAHVVLKTFHLLPAEAHHVVNVFMGMNIFLLLFMAVLFFKLCSILNISREAEIIGFSALFFNFAVLKQTFYYPVLTDVFAYFFGLLLVYGFFARNRTVQFLALFGGSFTYPLFFVTGIFLFINPDTKVLRNLFSQLVQVLSALVPVLFLALFVAYGVWDASFIQPQYRMHVNDTIIYLSVILAMFVLYRIMKSFELAASIQQDAKSEYRNIVLASVISISYFIVQWTIAKLYTVPETVFTTSTFLLNIFQQSFAQPLGFLVFHTLYLGPLVLIIVYHYRSLLQNISVHSFGLLLFVFIYSLLALGTETRQFINAWPVMVVMALLWLTPLKIGLRHAMLFAFTSVMLSRFYLPVNRSGIYETYEYGKFPEQLYFMNHGPFSTDKSYYIGLVMVLFTAAVLWFTLVRFWKKTLDNS
jgi:hypothetical protein